MQGIAELIFGGGAERFPRAKFFSVESGGGWVPVFFVGRDYPLQRTGPSLRHPPALTPSEYFPPQFYGCFWFERLAINRMLDVLGVNNVLFETDFPHPTCLYPKSDQRVRDALSGLDAHSRRRLLQDNAAELYNIPLPAAG